MLGMVPMFFDGNVFEGYFWYWFYHSLNTSPQDFPPLS